MKLNTEQKDILKAIWYAPNGFQGMNKLWGEAKKQDPKITDRSVREWMKEQEVYQLHKVPKKRKSYNRIGTAKGPNYIWFADLIDMRKISGSNRGKAWGLTVIDIYSRKAWAIPIKDKSGVEVTKGLKSIGSLPKILQTDQGREFLNESFEGFLKSKKVTHRITEAYTPTQNATIERWNGTFKQRLNKYMTAYDTKRWIDVVQKFVDSYNNEYHRIIKMSPNEAHNGAKTPKIKQRFQPDSEKPSIFKKGQLVRVAIPEGSDAFRKGYAQRFSTNRFKVKGVFQIKGSWLYRVEEFPDVLFQANELVDSNVSSEFETPVASLNLAEKTKRKETRELNKQFKKSLAEGKMNRKRKLRANPKYKDFLKH